MTMTARSMRFLPCRVAPLAGALVVSLAITACAVGPDYVRPSAPTSPIFKEAPVEAGATWFPAAPADALERGPWWTLFGDAELTRLTEQIEVSNQNVAVAVANYAQAQALVGEQRAALFPALGLQANAQRSGGGRSVNGLSNASSSFGVSAVGSWAPDLWGRLRRGVEGAEANRDASAADLAAARLSAQGALAFDYFSLRESDAELGLLRSSIEGFTRSLQITQNRYAAGIVPKTDVLQAQTQLATTQADLSALVAQRARYEHAIAVLVGTPPGSFSVAIAPWTQTVPAVPLGVPSALLERRPDIASAERSVAASNADIGIARSAYYPSLTLSGSVGTSGTRIGDLFNAPRALWSFGTSIAQTLFDGGAIRSRVQVAEAARDAATARYRQTVLTAFQDVEDQLVSLRSYADQEVLRRTASTAADQTEQQILNRYRAGQVSYTDVVTAQASALSARRTMVQIVANRQTGAAALIQALGGGWRMGDDVALSIDAPGSVATTTSTTP